MLSQGLNHIVEFQAQLLGFDNEFLQLALQQGGTVSGTGFSDHRDHSSDADSHFKHSLCYQLADDFVRGVWIDLKLLTQRANGWEGVSRSYCAGDNRPFGGINNLLI